MEGEVGGEIIIFGTVSAVLDMAKLCTNNATAPGVVVGETMIGEAEPDAEVRELGQTEGPVDDQEIVWREEEGAIGRPVVVQLRGSWAHGADGGAARKRVMQAPVEPKIKKVLPVPTRKTQPASRCVHALPSRPPPPSISQCGTDGALITWGASPESPVTTFEVEAKRSGDVRWTLIYHGVAKAYTVFGLSPGIEFGVRVRAVNLTGKSAWSEEAHFYTLPAPSAPKKVRRKTTTVKSHSPPPQAARTTPTSKIHESAPPPTPRALKNRSTTPPARTATALKASSTPSPAPPTTATALKANYTLPPAPPAIKTRSAPPPTDPPTMALSSASAPPSQLAHPNAAGIKAKQLAWPSPWTWRWPSVAAFCAAIVAACFISASLY